MFTQLLAALEICLVVAQPPQVNDSPAKLKNWKEPFATAVRGADRIVIELVGERAPKFDAEIRGAAKILELLKRIEIDDAKSGDHCMCDGDRLFQFYKGEQKLATIGHHHGFGLRWHGGPWKGDARLTDSAQAAMPRWFQENGYASLQQEREHAEKVAKERAEKEARFISCFPEAARKWFEVTPASARATTFDEEDKRQGKGLAAAIDDPAVLAISLCRAFGTLQAHDATWSGTGGKERVALNAARTLTGEAFLTALEKVKDDRDALRGAARFFFFEDMRTKIPADVRPKWTVRLAEIVVMDDYYDNHHTTLRYLRHENQPIVRELLNRIRRGEIGNESAHTPGSFDEPGIRASAAIMLVRMGETDFKEEIKPLIDKTEVKSDRATYEVCLALLGDPIYLKAEHFKLSSYIIGFGGLDAIERHQGRHGIEALVVGGIHHPWAAVNDEAVKVFQRLMNRKWTKDEIEDWWEEGAEGRNPKATIQNIGRLATWRTEGFGSPALAFHPNGREFAVADQFDVALVSIKTGAKVRKFTGADRAALRIVFSTDGRRMVSTGYDSKLREWDTESGKQLREHRLGDVDSPQFLFSADGVLIALEEKDGKLALRDFIGGNELFPMDAPGEDVEHVLVHVGDRSSALVQKNGAITIWDDAGKRKRTEFQSKPRDVGPIISYRFQFLVQSPNPTTAEIWDVTKNSHIATLKTDASWPQEFAFTPDDKHVLVGDKEGHVRILELTGGKEVHSFRAHTTVIKRFDFSRDGKLMATQPMHGTTKIWDMGKVMSQTQVQDNPPFTGGFRSDHR